MVRKSLTKSAGIAHELYRNRVVRPTDSQAGTNQRRPTPAVTAAVQVLAYLDGSAAPITLDATLEVSPPDLVPRVRRWTSHPECGCAQREPRATGDNGP